MKYKTIQVRYDEAICFLRLHRPEANNTINDQLIEECTEVLRNCKNEISIVVLEGLPEVFCFGADFKLIQEEMDDDEVKVQRPEKLYELFTLLSNGSFVSIAHVQGKVNAGGVGFVAACDIVIADEKATFGLSELLFGLFPACVLPFLIRKIGFQHAHYMTLMNKPIPVQQAEKYGLVDMFESDSKNLLRKHLLHLRRLSKKSILEYKKFAYSLLSQNLNDSKKLAVNANRIMFENKDNLNKISCFVKDGKIPWK